MTKLLSFDETGFQFAWDSTSISSFEKCPRFYQLKHVEGWYSNRKSVHLLFGGWYASALENYHKLRAAGSSEDEAVCAVVLQTLKDTWIDGAPWESDHSAKTRDTLIRSIVWYLDQFGSDDTMPTVILPDGRAAVEYSFSVELAEDIVYCGHIDRLVNYSGGVYVQDQKTSGSTITQRYFDDFSPDIQMSGYTYAGKIIFDIAVSGVIIDAAQIAVGFTSFSRGVVHRSPAQLEEWRKVTLATIDEAKRCHTSGEYPMRRTSCSNYGGCEFRKICCRNPEHRERMLEADFHKSDRWDPLKKR